MTKLHVKITGLDRLKNIFGAFKADSKAYLNAAGLEAGEEVVNTEGLRKYPPPTAANAPPAPYYIRGRGMQLGGTKRGEGGRFVSRNDGKSERYGTQFYVRAEGLKTAVGNRARYAHWLTDEQKQARAMQRIGWRKLIDVAREKQPNIVKIFEGWINKYFKDKGLK
jgi:hypothetical protein